MNKKGAEMTIGTIIIIVLALIVLVVLIVGFTGGWSNLWGKIINYFGGPNVDTIVQACELSCTAGNQYDYCKDRTLKWDGPDGKLVSAKISCKGLESENGKSIETEKNGPQNLPKVDLSCSAITACPSGGAVTAKSCKGTPTACGSLTQAECIPVTGCTLSGTMCSGMANLCNTFTKDTDCAKQKGCAWE